MRRDVRLYYKVPVSVVEGFFWGNAYTHKTPLKILQQCIASKEKKAMTLCIRCDEHITNPIHPERLMAEVKQWLHQVAPYMLPIFPTMKRSLPQSNLDETCETCIHSGKKTQLCPYCVSEHIYDWLCDMDAPRGVIERYLKLFSYDHEHKGFEVRARRYGHIDASWPETKQKTVHKTPHHSIYK